MNKEGKIDSDIEQIIQKDPESLLNELKEKAQYIEINRRKEFEQQLLRLAQKTGQYKKRDAIYEVLVSLQIIWNQFRPIKGLQGKFQVFLAKRNYLEAEECYKKLIKQGLDYIKSPQIGRGELVPLVTGNEHFLLQYNERELTLYNLQIKRLVKVPLPEDQTVVDVHTPFTRHLTGHVETSERKESNQEIWLLLESKQGKKKIVSIDMKSLKSIRQKHKFPEKQTIYLDQKMYDVNRLSYFKNYIILASNRSIYGYQDDSRWTVWYTVEEKNKITAIEPTREGLWVGQKNGEFFVLKKVQNAVVRSVFGSLSEAIKKVWKTDRFVLIYSQNCLKTFDFGYNPVSVPFTTPGNIKQVAMLDNNLILIHLTNGMLMALDIKQGNISWKINLGDMYSMLLVSGRHVLCGKGNGKTMVFEIPPLSSMAEKLEEKSIYVEKKSAEVAPTAPVRSFSDFIGRKEILNEIRGASDTHIIIYGEPRVGKTSLLNVIRDVLSEEAGCCVVNMAELLRKADTHESFESSFIEKCLDQHLIKSRDLPARQGYLALRAITNKIKGDRDYCLFGFDGFFIPNHFDEKNKEDFKTFLDSIIRNSGVRLIITCSTIHRYEINEYFEDFKNTLEKRSLLYREIPFFSEVEIKNALREKFSLQQSLVEKVYGYTGRFPHLSHLYDRWAPNKRSIEEQSSIITETYSTDIFEYFRDLSPNARLIVATCIYNNLMSGKISYERFLEQFPFIKNCLSKMQLVEAIREIGEYGSGLSSETSETDFTIFLSDNARLFYEAVQHISWAQDFIPLYKFVFRPSQRKAHEVALAFTRITLSGLDENGRLKQKTARHSDNFYVNKLSDQGLQALRMPLTTFIVVLLTPWRKNTHADVFRDLNIEFQEFNRKRGELSIFYTLLFELYGTPKEDIKEDLEGIERISIIDTPMMKDIIMSISPQKKASVYIFNQLSISERSPYTIAGAVPDSLFFGREMEIALIRGLPENIGVFGTRTIGKTSLLRRLHKTFQQQKRWKVYDMDCSRIESEESLLKNLAEKMDVHFDKISDIEKFRRYVTKDAETSGYRYLFLLDEVDRLVQYDLEHDERIFNTFNRLYNETMKNNETAARFILFGFQQMFEQMKNPLSRLYNFMVFMPLQALDMDSAMNLVTRPIENIQVRWNGREDAKHLVDSCSRHPRLLQAACHVLLTNLDKKKINRDKIERPDVDMALTSPEFRETCMRLYHDHDENGYSGRKKKVLFTKTEPTQKKPFSSDLHRITILSAIRLLFVEKKEKFTGTDIRQELKKYKINVSPNIMRNILDQLCLSGNFRLLDESTLLAKKNLKIQEEIQQIEIKNSDLKIENPEMHEGSETTIPKFSYEFAIKIFPKLLAAHFGGLQQCNEELQKLIMKGAWKKWLRRQ